MIENTIQSLNLVFGDKLPEIIISHDGIPNSLIYLEKQYKKYLSDLRKIYAEKQNIKIILMPKHGHLTNNILFAINHVKTEFVLIVQHDLPFISKIEIGKCMSAFQNNDLLKHLRFNRENNFPYEFDLIPKSRKKYFREVSFQTSKGALQMIKTLAWSDNNHLCRRSYYLDIVSKIVKNRRIPPEHALNKSSDRITTKFLGTYIYGEIGRSPCIMHLDGRSGDVISKHTTNDFVPSFLAFKTKLRPTINLVETLFYKFITYYYVAKFKMKIKLWKK